MKRHAVRLLTVLGTAGMLAACGGSSGSGSGANDSSGPGTDATSPSDVDTPDGGGTPSDATNDADAADASNPSDATLDSATPVDSSADSASTDTGTDAGADASSDAAPPADASAADSSSTDAAGSDAAISDAAGSDGAASDASDSGGGGNGCNDIVNGAQVVTLKTVNAPAPAGTGGVFYPGTYYLTSAVAYLPDGGTAPAETLQVTVGLFQSGGGGANWQYAYDWARSVNGAPDDLEDFWFNAAGSTFYLQETCPISAYPEGGSFTYDDTAKTIHLYFVPAGASYTVEEVYTHQ